MDGFVAFRNEHSKHKRSLNMYLTHLRSTNVYGLVDGFIAIQYERCGYVYSFFDEFGGAEREASVPLLTESEEEE